MMNRLYQFLALVLAGLLLFGWIRYSSHISSLQRDLSDLNAYALGQDSLLTVTDRISERRANEVTSLRLANRALADSIPDLVKRNAQLNRQLQTWSTLVAYYESVQDSGTAHVEHVVTPTGKELHVNVKNDYLDATLDATASGDTLGARTTLNVSQKGIRVQYWLDSRTKDYYLSITHDPQIYHFVLSQDKSGNWVANWQVPDYITVGNISTLVVPYRLHWWERLGLTIGATTEPAGFVGLTYAGWSGGLYLTESARHIYASRTWYLGGFLKRR